jgi:hypothetical protein
MTNLIEVTKPKRGRKSKKDIIAAAAAAANENKALNAIDIKIDENLETPKIKEAAITQELLFSSSEMIEDNEVVKPPAKKRGRKPKGGKIVQQIENKNIIKEEKPNVILHLKCSLKDLQMQTMNNFDLEPFHFSNNKNELNFDLLNGHTQNTKSETMYNEDTSMKLTKYEENDNYEKDSESEKEVETKQIWKKLKQLQHNLHANSINDKKSACFWCTYDFDNPPVYIPKHYIKDSYHVYGCFCSPECAVAFLMEENIDSSTKFERYHLLNHIYAKIYNYTKNIKPSPNPYYMLDKYYGNLNIQEYRALLKNERFFLIVDKPLTRILPELHEDNEDHIINNKIIPSNNYNIKKKLIKRSQNKHNILNEKFGIQSQN